MRDPEVSSHNPSTNTLPPSPQHPNLAAQIRPLRIILRNQVILPSPPPPLQRLLKRNRVVHLIEQFIINKALNIIAFGMAFNLAGLMFGNTQSQIRRHAHINRAMRAARQNINIILPPSHRQRITERHSPVISHRCLFTKTKRSEGVGSRR